MATLLIRLCGPMQSWGTRSRFTERDTEREPSKSAVTGLLCAALGRPRAADVADLAALRMGVRGDNEGIVARDYQTAGAVGGVRRACGSLSTDAVLSMRYYWAGADFLVALEVSDEVFLAGLEEAVKAPHWQLSLGRKSFVPSVPLGLPGGGIRRVSLEQALHQEPWPLLPRAWPWPRENVRQLRIVLETSFDDPNHEVRMDQPLGAAFRDRTFGPRPIVQSFFEKERSDVSQPSHA